MSGIVSNVENTAKALEILLMMKFFVINVPESAIRSGKMGKGFCKVCGEPLEPAEKGGICDWCKEEPTGEELNDEDEN